MKLSIQGINLIKKVSIKFSIFLLNGPLTMLLLERASLQVLTSVDRKVHIMNYQVYYPVPSFIKCNSTG